VIAIMYYITININIYSYSVYMKWKILSCFSIGFTDLTKI